jgi:hypothetical protein
MSKLLQKKGTWTKNAFKRTFGQLTFKDVVSPVLSLIALAISGLVAYFGIAFHADEISIAYRDAPSVASSDEGQLQVWQSDLTATFINLGNRPAAIIEVKLRVNQPDFGEAYASCDFKANQEKGTFVFQQEPFSIKAGEIETKSMKISGSANFPVKGTNQGKKENTITLCLGVRIVTPGFVSDDIWVELYRDNMVSLPSYEAMVAHEPKPLTLYRHRSW